MLSADFDTRNPSYVTLGLGRMRLQVPRHFPIQYYESWILGAYSKLRLSPGTCVLDAGANIGDYTVLAAKAVGQSGRVIAVEPNPELFKTLLRNVELNGLRNVTPVNCAVAQFDGEVEMQGDKLRYLAPHLSADHPFKARATQIDTLLERLGGGGVSILKMDIEGAEEDALAGQKFLSGVTQVAIELHGAERAGRVLQHLRAHGFKMEQVKMSDLASHAARVIPRHLLSFLSSDRRLGFFGLKYMAKYAFKGESKLRDDFEKGAYALYYGARRLVDRPTDSCIPPEQVSSPRGPISVSPRAAGDGFLFDRQAGGRKDQRDGLLGACSFTR